MIRGRLAQAAAGALGAEGVAEAGRVPAAVGQTLGRFGQNTGILTSKITWNLCGKNWIL
jgi:hypothetical protein